MTRRDEMMALKHMYRKIGTLVADGRCTGWALSQNLPPDVIVPDPVHDAYEVALSQIPSMRPSKLQFRCRHVTSL